MRMLTKCAVRTAMRPVLLGVAEARRNPPERSFAEGLLVFGPIVNANATSSPPPGTACRDASTSYMQLDPK